MPENNSIVLVTTNPNVESALISGSNTMEIAKAIADLVRERPAPRSPLAKPKSNPEVP